MSLLDATLDVADWWQDFANWVLIASLIVGAIATFVVIRTGSIKEEFLRRDLAATNERAASAHERAAESERQAAALRLELQRLENPRQLNISAFREALVDKPPREVEILYQPGSNESHNLAMQIFTALLSSTWKPADLLKPFPRPIPSTAARAGLKELEKISPELFNAAPPLLRLTTSPFGISIMANKSPSEPNAPQRALADAIRAGDLSVSMGVLTEMPDGLVLVVVGPRP